MVRSNGVFKLSWRRMFQVHLYPSNVLIFSAIANEICLAKPRLARAINNILHQWPQNATSFLVCCVSHIWIQEIREEIWEYRIQEENHFKKESANSMSFSPNVFLITLRLILYRFFHFHSITFMFVCVDKAIRAISNRPWLHIQQTCSSEMQWNFNITSILIANMSSNVLYICYLILIDKGGALFPCISSACMRSL